MWGVSRGHPTRDEGAGAPVHQHPPVAGRWPLLGAATLSHFRPAPRGPSGLRLPERRTPHAESRCRPWLSVTLALTGTERREDTAQRQQHLLSPPAGPVSMDQHRQASRWGSSGTCDLRRPPALLHRTLVVKCPRRQTRARQGRRGTWPQRFSRRRLSSSSLGACSQGAAGGGLVPGRLEASRALRPGLRAGPGPGLGR